MMLCVRSTRVARKPLIHLFDHGGHREALSATSSKAPTLVRSHLRPYEFTRPVVLSLSNGGTGY